MNNIAIELAKKEDIESLLPLLEELFSLEEEFSFDAELQRKALQMLVESDNARILVAKNGAEVIGMVSLQYLVSSALGERAAILEDMAVLQKHRGEGIGGMLLEKAKSFAQEEGIRRITLLTDTTNIPARKFYQKHGFHESSMIPLRLFL